MLWHALASYEIVMTNILHTFMMYIHKNELLLKFIETIYLKPYETYI